MIHMPLKWHHKDKCNKKYRKVDVLTPILACLRSSAPNCIIKNTILCESREKNHNIWKIHYMQRITKTHV